MTNFNEITPSDVVSKYKSGNCAAAFYVLLLRNKQGLFDVLQKANPLWWKSHIEEINGLNDASVQANFLAEKQISGLLFFPKQQTILATGSVSARYTQIASILSAQNASSGMTAFNFLDQVSGFLGGKNTTKTGGGTSSITVTKPNYIPLVAGVVGMGALTLLIIKMVG